MMSTLPKKGNLELVSSLRLAPVFFLATGPRKWFALITDLLKIDWKFSNWIGSHDCCKPGVSIFIIIRFSLKFARKTKINVKIIKLKYSVSIFKVIICQKDVFLFSDNSILFFWPHPFPYFVFVLREKYKRAEKWCRKKQDDFFILGRTICFI